MSSRPRMQAAQLNRGALGGPPLLVPNPHTGEPACSSFARSCTASLGRCTALGREVPRDGETERQGRHAEDACHDRRLRRPVLDARSQMEVATMAEFERMMQGGGQNSEDMKEFESIMKGYHDLVDHGRREIYKIEA